MKPSIIILLSTFILVACVGPNAKKVWLERHAKSCLELGKLDLALNCLNKNGKTSWHIYPEKEEIKWRKSVDFLRRVGFYSDMKYQQVIKDGKPNINSDYSSMSCTPFWGYPLVRSCVGIRIKYKDNIIKSYRYWAELDAL